MAERTASFWTCDRCRTGVEVKHGEQPSGWGRVSIAMPPRSDEPKPEGDYCSSCLYDIRYTAANPPPRTDDA